MERGRGSLTAVGCDGGIREVKFAVAVGASWWMARTRHGVAQRREPSPTVPTPTVEGPITHGQRTDRGAEHELRPRRRSATSRPSTSSPAPRARTRAHTPLTDDGKWTVHPTLERSVHDPHRRLPPHRSASVQRHGHRSSGSTSAAGSTRRRTGRSTPRRADPRGDTRGSASPRRRSGSSAARTRSSRRQALKHADPVRYGSLEHPGDQFSYDIYSQAAAGGAQGPATVLGGLKPKHSSRSASRSRRSGSRPTSTPSSRAAPTMYDGFLVHSRGRRRHASSTAPTRSQRQGSVRIRSDLDVPVLVVHHRERPRCASATSTRATARHQVLPRLEVAGTSHYDTLLARRSGPRTTARSAPTPRSSTR